MPSEFAVEVHTEEDIIAVVNFAHSFDLRLVVKATGVLLLQVHYILTILLVRS